MLQDRRSIDRLQQTKKCEQRNIFMIHVSFYCTQNHHLHRRHVQTSIRELEMKKNRFFCSNLFLGLFWAQIHKFTHRAYSSMNISCGRTRETPRKLLWAGSCVCCGGSFCCCSCWLELRQRHLFGSSFAPHQEFTRDYGSRNPSFTSLTTLRHKRKRYSQPATAW